MLFTKKIITPNFYRICSNSTKHLNIRMVNSIKNIILRSAMAISDTEFDDIILKCIQIGMVKENILENFHNRTNFPNDFEIYIWNKLVS